MVALHHQLTNFLVNEQTDLKKNILMLSPRSQKDEDQHHPCNMARFEVKKEGKDWVQIIGFSSHIQRCTTCIMYQHGESAMKPSLVYVSNFKRH